MVDQDDAPWVTLIVLEQKLHQGGFSWVDYIYIFCASYRKLNKTILIFEYLFLALKKNCYLNWEVNLPNIYGPLYQLLVDIGKYDVPGKASLLWNQQKVIMK